jgi:UDP-GlcNAc:undecaprenyl-phosphate GlcNAc-1-phosphate transferase
LSDGVRLAGSVGLSLVTALVVVPLVIRLALRTGFVDRPGGYKRHARATPYLGGVAVALAVAASVLVFGVATSRFAPILIWAAVLFVVGTVDDKRNLSPYARLAIEAFAGIALWHYGLNWNVFDNNIANLFLTVFWVVGLVNAFNLMDNMDGAAATVGAVCATGAAIAAIIGGDVALAVIVLAVAGACVGFLRYNLAKPARQFLGDGGSMPLGFVVAAVVMVEPNSYELGWAAIFAAAPLVGLPILDTTLVVLSRRRAGRPILSGARDHLTHRLAYVVGSPRAVAVVLAATQIMLCAAAISASHLPRALVALSGAVFLVAGAYAIYVLETPGRGRLSAAVDAVASTSVAPERSTA